MNPALIVYFLKERLLSPIRLGLLALFLVIPLVSRVIHPECDLPGTADVFWLVLILGAGIIGRDLSSGVLQLLLARPIRRSTYVLSRWTALGSAAGALGFLLWALTLLIAVIHGSELPALREILFNLIELQFAAFGVAAVLVFFSSCLGGFGDLALFLVGGMVISLLGMVGRWRHIPVLLVLAKHLFISLMPHLELAPLFKGEHDALVLLVSWISTVTLSLALAIVLMNRKEFSYASG